MISIRRFFRSFKHALHGLWLIARREQSFRLQLFAAIVVFIAALLLPLAVWEFVLVLLLIGAILVLEVMNSIIESISDALKPRFHPMVKEVKDMMAGAVLIMAIISVVIAWMIFYPHLSVLF
jgi:undecaprenol kinase